MESSEVRLVLSEMTPSGERDRTSSLEAGGGGLYLRELTTDALRYWEPRRLVCNLLLALVVLGHFAAAWPSSRSAVTVDGVLGLFILAVLANVAFLSGLPSPPS